jgi:PleD family two-component response regulator
MTSEPYPELAFITLPDSSDDLLKMADNLMYGVKADGKNAVHYFIHREQAL